MKTAKFDPGAPATADAGIFGFPYAESHSAVVLVPVPWEVTTSYRGGTAAGPEAILRASPQLDFYDLDVEDPHLLGIHMLAPDPRIETWNAQGRPLAERIIENQGLADTQELQQALSRVNELGARLNELVAEQTERLVDKGKIVGIVGGDHSVPLGAIEVLARRHDEIGILHFDAHSDTRSAYEGFTFSHASVMHNVLERVPQVTKLVQVGLRDFCEQEMEFLRLQGARVSTWFDRDMSHERLRGNSFANIARAIVADLPEKVWISFDIDALDPRHCPHTGTPVPGGFDFNEAVFVIGEVARSKRTIVGFDLVEVAPGQKEDDWDGNVGARLLYKLIAFTLASQGKAALR
ncbi:MAG: agmatinase family protein [Myxococcota bacterium]|nr:agmatinase family protein [Myxococcota bacterium]